MDIIQTLFDSMDSEYIQENCDQIIDLLGRAARVIQKLSKDVRDLAVKSDNGCEYCKHHQPCDGKNCKDYIEGKTARDYKGCQHDWEWSCMDFRYGECPKLENTPCNMCNFENNWEWREK